MGAHEGGIQILSAIEQGDLQSAQRLIPDKSAKRKR
jgi:hypothetical protein